MINLSSHFEKFFLSADPVIPVGHQLNLSEGINFLFYNSNNTKKESLNDILKDNAIYFICPLLENLTISISGEAEDEIECKVNNMTLLIVNEPANNSFTVTSDGHHDIIFLKITGKFFEHNPEHCLHNAIKPFCTSELSDLICFPNFAHSTNIIKVVNEVKRINFETSHRNLTIRPLMLELKYIFIIQYLNFVGYEVLTDFEKDKIRKLEETIVKNSKEPCSPENIARLLEISVDKLIIGCYLTFNQHITQYVNRIKMREIRLQMHDGYTDIASLAYKHGYANRSHFTKIFRTEFGCPPIEYASKIN